MKKFYILAIIICVLILTLCVEKIFYNFISLSFGYEYVLWCNKDDKTYIIDKTGLKGNFNIIVCNANYHQELYVIKEFPYGIGKKVNVSHNDSIVQYVKENTNPMEAFLRSILIYTLFGIITIILISISSKKISQYKKS